MTTLDQLAQARLREQHDAQLAKKSEAEALRKRILAEKCEVLRLFRRDILGGAELPAGATIGTRVSNIHGHQVVVRFPGNLSIDAEFSYTAAGEQLIARGCHQRWVARHHPVGKQKTFDDFLDAFIWLLDIKLDLDLPAPPPVEREPAIPRLLVTVDRIHREQHIVGLRSLLDRFRCTCGSFPSEAGVGEHWCVLCSPCDYEWSDWEDFLEWKEQ
jgi:hypothetical protein